LINTCGLRKLGRYGRHFPLPLFCVNFSFAMHRGLCISIHRTEKPFLSCQWGFAFFTTIQICAIFRQNITGRVEFCRICTLLIPLQLTTSFPSSHLNERCVQMLVCLHKREKSDTASAEGGRGLHSNFFPWTNLKKQHCKALYALTFFRRVSSERALQWGVWVYGYIWRLAAVD